MKQARSAESPKAPERLRPSLTPEADENQLISLAIDTAKKKMLDGTASNSIILHYLKLATSREKMEREMLETQMELAKAKKQALESQARVEELYADAMRAMQRYSGQEEDQEEDYEFY